MTNLAEMSFNSLSTCILPEGKYFCLWDKIWSIEMPCLYLWYYYARIPTSYWYIAYYARILITYWYIAYYARIPIAYWYISFSKLSSHTSKLISVISSKSKTSLYRYRLIEMKRHGSKWFTNVWLNKCMNLILQFIKILNTYNYCKLSFVGKIFRSVRNQVP